MAEDVIALVAPLILDGLWGTLISRVFTVSILFLALFFPLLSIIPGFKTNSKSFVFDHVPVLLTSIGLFGTFVGIAVGLASFDVANVDKSLPQLLNGMKLAFWTSILGMACALAYKLFQVMIGFFRKHEEYRGVTANDIYAVMQEQQKMLALQEGLLNAIKNTINDKETGSISAQLQAFKEESASAMKAGRESMELHLKEIAEQYRLFTENMTKNNTDAVVEALKEVIRDFNAKINEQFGENFKELNHAVGELLIWQKNYKEHVETLEGHFEMISEKMQGFTRALEMIAEESKAIPHSMEIFRELMIDLETELKQSAGFMESFVVLRNEAATAFPVIKQGIEKLTLGFSESVLESTRKTEQVIAKMEDLFEGLSKRYTALALHHQSLLQQSVEKIESLFADTFSSISDDLKEKFNEFDKLMETEMSNAITRLGRQMASIAQKLVDDNSRIVDQYSGLAKYLASIPVPFEKTGSD